MNGGKPSCTKYAVLKTFENYSVVECTLKTGRTHQIRVHFSAIGHPLLGDTLYGTASNLINRQALHSYEIMCIHPVLQKKLFFKADLPDDFKNIILDNC